MADLSHSEAASEALIMQAQRPRNRYLYRIFGPCNNNENVDELGNITNRVLVCSSEFGVGREEKKQIGRNGLYSFRHLGVDQTLIIYI